MQNGLHQMCALLFDDGLQLAPTMLIFGNFRCFKVQFYEQKNRQKFVELYSVLQAHMWKMACIKCVHFTPMMAYSWF